MSFLAILYKAWRIRIRHYFQTFFLIALPLIFPILVISQSGSQNTTVESHQWVQNPIIYNKVSKDQIITNGLQNYLTVAYCSKNNFTTTIIDKVKKKLRTATFISFKDEEDIDKWFMNNSEISAKYGVVFEMKESDLKPPYKFKYTIKSTNPSLPTNILFPIYHFPGPMEAGAPYFQLGFLSLKVLIDDAVLNNTGIKESNWTLQEFPYPAHKRNEDNGLKAIFEYISVIMASLFLYTFNTITSYATNEKSSGIMERMRMFGMNDFMLLLSYIVHGLLTSGISSLLMVILMKIPAGIGPIFAESSWFILWIVLIIFCAQSICFFLAVSSLFTNNILATYVPTILFFLPYGALQANVDMAHFPTYGQVLTSFLPITYLYWAMQNIYGFESVGQGSDIFSIIKVPPGGYCNLPLIVVLLLSLIGCLLLSLIYVYIINVNPGPFGHTKPWHFIFPKKLCSLFKVSPSVILRNESEVDVCTRGVYERVPDNVEVGLKIVNLHKRIGNVIPVKDISLDVYVGQITALLGHNGAGKTTTLSIISGIFSPTSGSIFYRGYNIFTNLKGFRYELGLCPQEDMLIPDISPWEHLIFFGMVKGIPLKELIASAKSALLEVGLNDRKYVIVSQLSGGMKRKLCLALALIGFPKVIVLDEPTSGLDPESRREIWNILLKLRENRVMIITTHFMEEADVLGDQIAIMDHGSIICYGTPMFLKRQYGAGYHITVSSSNASMFSHIIQFVKSKIPSAVVSKETEDSIVFDIGSSNTECFPEVFESLESKEEFHITRIGVNCTSMEDVFLKVRENADGSIEDLTLNGQTLNKLGHLSTALRGSSLSSFFKRFYALLIKNVLYVKDKWLLYLFTVAALPLLIAYWTMSGTISLVDYESSDPSLTFDLKLYGNTEVLVNGNKLPKIRTTFVDLIRNRGSYDVDLVSLKKSDIIEGLLFSATQDELKFRQSMIVAGDFSDSLPNILFSSVAIHSPVIAVDLLYNSILKSEDKNYSISTTHQPLIFESTFCSQSSSVVIAAVIASWIILVFCLGGVVSQCFIKSPHTERTSILKHLQLMTGVSPFTYWLSFFIWDLIIYCSCITLILIILTSIDTVGMLSHNGAGVLYLIMFLFGFSGLWFSYCFSYFFKTSTHAVTLFSSVLVILIVATLILFNLIQESSKYICFVYILRLIPVCPFVSAIQKFTTTAIQLVQCSYCPNLSAFPPCKELQNKGYFDSDMNKELYFLGLDWILYLALIILIEFGYVTKLWNLLNSLYIGPLEKSDLVSVESDVAKEKDRVDAALHATDNNGAPTVIVDGLAKKFSSTITAVHDVSFATKEGECFGLLGVNGAGKSTTFNILTGIQIATEGRIIVNGYNLSDNKWKCLSFFGYCPQSSALAEYMTGRQMLTLFASLRLTHSSDIQNLVNKWISLLGLEEYCDRACGTYSGGNKRKLSTALAFISNPSIILLDEPTSGVDPVTRRKLWIVLKECQGHKQTVIISSHSMDECEAVCDRLTIMAQGYMQCIGSVQHLKMLYGQGFVILIKLKSHSDDEVQNLKDQMTVAFEQKATLKDEHMVMLHYHIDGQTFKLSTLFSVMEKMKEELKIIDDYSISDSSLEHVFLSFAKKSDRNEIN